MHLDACYNLYTDLFIFILYTKLDNFFSNPLSIFMYTSFFKSPRKNAICTFTRCIPQFLIAAIFRIFRAVSSLSQEQKFHCSRSFRLMIFKCSQSISNRGCQGFANSYVAWHPWLPIYWSYIVTKRFPIKVAKT